MTSYIVTFVIIKIGSRIYVSEPFLISYACIFVSNQPYDYKGTISNVRH